MAILDTLKNLFSSDNAQSLVRNNIGLILNENPFASDITNSRSGVDELTDPIQATLNSQAGQGLDRDKFPPDLSNQFISLTFSKYLRPTPTNSASLEGKYVVDLPIPRVLTEQHTMNLTPQSLKTVAVVANEIEGALGDNFIQNIEKITGGGALNAVGDTAFSATSQFFMDNNPRLGIFSGEQVFGTVQQALGFIPNPHMSIFFNGVDLRPPIEFSWIFTPRDAGESETIRKILKKIKTKILPEVSSGNANIMNYPHILEVRISGVAEDMAPIYKRGLVSAIAINYTPNGPSFFKGTRSPTFIAFSFTLQEIEVFSAKDYGGSDARNISGMIGDIGRNTFNSALETFNTARAVQTAIRNEGLGL